MREKRKIGQKKNPRLERVNGEILLKDMKGFSSSLPPKIMAKILTLIIHFQASESGINRWLAN